MASFGSGVKAVQRGQKTLTGTSDTVTITAVVLVKSFLIFSNDIAGAITNSSAVAVRGQITNTTTLTFSRTNSAENAIIEWQVIEYY